MKNSANTSPSHSRLARTSTTKGTADNGPLWAVEEAVILLRPRPPFPTLPWLRLLILAARSAHPAPRRRTLPPACLAGLPPAAAALPPLRCPRRLLRRPRGRLQRKEVTPQSGASFSMNIHCAISLQDYRSGTQVSSPLTRALPALLQLECAQRRHALTPVSAPTASGES